jgi:hypothetical protein
VELFTVRTSRRQKPIAGTKTESPEFATENSAFVSRFHCGMKGRFFEREIIRESAATKAITAKMSKSIIFISTTRRRIRI